MLVRSWAQWALRSPKGPWAFWSGQSWTRESASEPGPDAFMEPVDAECPGVPTGHEHSPGPTVLGASRHHLHPVAVDHVSFGDLRTAKRHGHQARTGVFHSPG